ncbi:MAG: cadherin repeat domain-containing protein, partial [Rhodothermales bacterium]|nr:cadherin repeat domain-containing protein [Rhodothermales bacterium]
DNGADNNYELTVQVSDGKGGVATQSIVVTVTDVKETPSFSSPSSITVAENNNSVMTITSTVDAGSTQHYSLIGSDDDRLFSINATTGVLSFIGTPNFESPSDVNRDNTYQLTVQVENEIGMTNAIGLSVAVVDVNEAPSLEVSEFTAIEGFVGGIGQLIMTDPDAGDALSLSIVGGAAQAYFSIDQLTGAITQQAPLLPGTYTLEVQLNDANGMSTNAVLQIRIVAAEPELGGANNTQNTSELYMGVSDTTEPTDLQAALSRNSSALPATYEASEKDASSRQTSTDSFEESSLTEASTTTSISDTIDTRFSSNPIETHQSTAVSNTTEGGQKTKQSRGYRVVLELLLEESEEVIEELGSAISSVMDASLFSITLTPEILNALSSMRDDVDEQQGQADERTELILTAGTAASITLTVGFVSWLLQSGSLLATAMSSSPLWRAIDPVPVLRAGNQEDDPEGHRVQ